MPVATETNPVARLVTKREPEGVIAPGDPGSVGDTALKDGLLIIGAAWAVLAFLAVTLRKYNI